MIQLSTTDTTGKFNVRGGGLRGRGPNFPYIRPYSVHTIFSFPSYFFNRPIPIFYHLREIPMAHVLPEDIISHWHLIKSVKYGNKAKEEWRSILKVSIILSLYKKKYHEI